MENDSGFCINCSHKHRGIAQCNYCDCDWTLVLKDDNMLKKIWNKIKSWLGIA